MDQVLILDFGSQVAQLIARRVREARVYCELHPYDMPIEAIRAFAPRAIILSGGPHSVYDQGYQADPALLDLGVPVLGICYGMQWMAQVLGGVVERGDQGEFGYAQMRARGHSPLFAGIEDARNTAGHGLLDVWMSHGDQVSTLPPQFVRIGETPACPIAAMADPARKLYGLQFHPEVTHTRRGADMLRRFVCDIAGAQPDWTMPHFIEAAVARIRAQVGHEQVILGLSGGVDSSVAATLIQRAIGDRLTCVFVDHGLLRLDEAEQVRETFAGRMGIKLISVDARDTFLTCLAGVTDPEQKRKIIGKAFVDIFQAEAQKLPQVRWLAQGTIYPDVIESARASTGTAHGIKSHHNVGGLPDTLDLALLEPLRELFKDEVRALGIELGLPSEMVYRHPFPGPGLAVRLIGEVRAEYADLLRRADAIFIDELRQTLSPQGKSWYDEVSQAFAVFLPVKSVGVMGDGRTYEYVCALRAVMTQDFMTAHWAELPYDLLARVSNRIINEVRPRTGIRFNRVVYDISGKPPATIEWE